MSRNTGQGAERVDFLRADLLNVPDHWRTFGKRASPLTGNPRLAANPPNSILNYLYAILEAECRIACLAVGLDPGLGVLYADQRNRDSMALDLMVGVESGRARGDCRVRRRPPFRPRVGLVG
jgi:hypothetical protein